MKTVFAAIATLLLLSSASTYANDNGVERGDIIFNAAVAIPKGVEDKIETTMFANCDLRGANRITTAYYQQVRDDSAAAITYVVEYEVQFAKENRTVMINANAVLHLQGAPETAVEIRAFNSAICRSIP